VIASQFDSFKKLSFKKRAKIMYLAEREGERGFGNFGIGKLVNSLKPTRVSTVTSYLIKQRPYMFKKISQFQNFKMHLGFDALKAVDREIKQ
jgi:hypothetical protein